MKPFKFFQKKKTEPILFRRSYVGLNIGEIHWVDLPIGMVYYMEMIQEDDIHCELKSTSIGMRTHSISSYNNFISLTQGKIIVAYHFISPTTGIIYTQENFDEMPRDSELMFRGRVLNTDVSDINL